jgi:hypothetical protein
MGDTEISVHTTPVHFWEHDPSVDYEEMQGDLLDHISEVIDDVECEGDVLIAFRLLLPIVTATGEDDVDEHFVFWTNDPMRTKEQTKKEFVLRDYERMNHLLQSWFEDPEDGNVRVDGELYHLLFMPLGDFDPTAPCIDVLFRLDERNDELFAAIGDHVQVLWDLAQFERVQRTAAS